MWSYLGSGGDGKEYVLINNDGIEQIMGQKSFNQKIIAKEGLSAPSEDKTDPVWSIDKAGNIKTTGEITGSRVHNAVWNDYAEWFEKENIEDVFEPGDICAWNKEGVVLSNIKNINSFPVGVCSDSYGIILGGKSIPIMEENKNNFVPIGLAGRVYVKVKDQIDIGDYITISEIDGVGKKRDSLEVPAIGIALQEKKDSNISKIKMLIK